MVTTATSSKDKQTDVKKITLCDSTRFSIFNLPNNNNYRGNKIIDWKKEKSFDYLV